ncbi:MAG: hypothetical protein AB3N64_06615 [Puniceicoccaceae bacterium]
MNKYTKLTLLLSMVMGMATSMVSAQLTLVTIIGDSVGNANFEDTSLSASTGGTPYSQIPFWENMNEASDPNFRVTQGMAGHPLNDADLGGTPGTNIYGAFLFKDRFSGNSTGYTMKAGDIFGLKFDISHHGGAAAWADGGDVEAIMFTTDATVDALYNMTEDPNFMQLASFTYTILEEPFWNMDVSAGTFYIASEADAGKKVYVAFTLRTSGANSPFPRLDNVVWQVFTTDTGPTDWNGFPIAGDGVSVDTGNFLGWIDISADPWLWVYATNNYIYTSEGFNESGGWAYWLK